MKTTFAISHHRWLSAPAGVAVASLLVVAQVAAQPLSAEPDAPPEVAAATDIPWVYVTVGGGLQTRPPRLSQLLVFDDTGDAYGGRVSSAAAWEASSFEADYRFDNPLVLDAGATFRVAAHVGIGIGVSHLDTADPAALTSVVPHPFFFERPREFDGASMPLTRQETALHLSGVFVWPIDERFTVMAFGGPTLFDLCQDIVTDVEFVHSYPYAAAEYGSAVSSTRTAQALGYYVGTDVSWYFTGHFGAGVLVRWTAAPVSLVPLSRGAVAPLDIDLGGLYAAAGVRVRF